MIYRHTYRDARSRVKSLKSFYLHLFIYTAVNIGLAGINLVASPGNIWFVFPLAGWGVGLFAHWLFAGAGFRLFSREWEERKVREIVERERDEG